VAIGLLILVFLRFRPQAILPERRRRIGASAPPKPIEIPNEDVVTLAGSLRAPGLAEATGQDGSAVRVTGRPITRSAPSSVAPGTADEGVVLRAVDVTRDFGGVHAVAGLSIEDGRLPAARPRGERRIDHVVSVFPRLGQMLTRRAGRLSGGELPTDHVRALAEAGAAVLVVEQRAKAVLAISDYTYVLGGGQVLMEGTPARLAASQEFTESFFGAVPQTPK
jgi:hypothetical protein